MTTFDSASWADEAPSWPGEADPMGGNFTMPKGATKGIVSHFTPTPFRLRDTCDIEPRQWLYGHHLVRKYVSVTIAPGGVGKSTLIVADAVAMASGKDLLGNRPHGPLKVWLWNGEDPLEEIERRVAATCAQYDIGPTDIAGRLYIDSGRETIIKIGTLGKQGVEIPKGVIDALVDAIVDRDIDVLIIDPFVSIHSVSENDNGAMDAVVKALAQIADRADCAIEIVHHTRKLNGMDSDMDSARGGSAIAGAVRSARALNVMSAETAASFGIHESDRRQYVRVDDVKANLSSAAKAEWFRLVPEPLGNRRDDRPEDWVAVAQAWSPPDALAGMGLPELAAVQEAVHHKCHRENFQSADWVGHVVGPILGLNSRIDPDKKRIKFLIKQWVNSGALVIGKTLDEKGNPRPTIEVGEWVKQPVSPP